MTRLKLRTVLPLTMLTSISISMLACSSTIEPPHAQSTSQITLTGVRVESFKGNERTGRALANSLTYERSAGVYVASSAKVELFGQTPAVISADRLQGELTSTRVLARGNVVAVIPDAGVRAYAPSAALDTETLTAVGDAGIRMVAPRYTVTSDSFWLGLANHEFAFDGNVHTEVGSGALNSP